MFEICGRMFQVCHWLLLQTVRCFKSKSTGYCLTFTTDLCFRSAPLAVLLDLPAGGCFRSAPVFCLRSTSACCLTGIYRWPLFQIYYWNANEDARTATMVELPLQTTEYVLTDLDESTLYAIRVAGINGGGYGRKSPTQYFTYGQCISPSFSPHMHLGTGVCACTNHLL